MRFTRCRRYPDGSRNGRSLSCPPTAERLCEQYPLPGGGASGPPESQPYIGVWAIVHLLTTGTFYLTKIGGDALPINQERLTTIDELVLFATAHNKRFVAFVTTLHDEDLAHEVTVEFSDKSQVRYLVWQVLTQVFLHSAHHRGELSILLSALGQPLPIDEIIVRFAEESGQPWPYKGVS